MRASFLIWIITAILVAVIKAAPPGSPFNFNIGSIDVEDDLRSLSRRAQAKIRSQYRAKYMQALSKLTSRYPDPKKPPRKNVVDRVRRELQHYKDSIISVEKINLIDKLNKRLLTLIDKVEKIYLPGGDQPSVNRKQDVAMLSKQIKEIMEKLEALEGEPMVPGKEQHEEGERSTGKSNANTMRETGDRSEFSAGAVSHPQQARFIGDHLSSWVRGVGHILQDGARGRPQPQNLAGPLGGLRVPGRVFAP